MKGRVRVFFWQVDGFDFSHSYMTFSLCKKMYAIRGSDLKQVSVVTGCVMRGGKAGHWKRQLQGGVYAIVLVEVDLLPEVGALVDLVIAGHVNENSSL